MKNVLRVFLQDGFFEKEERGIVASFFEVFHYLNWDAFKLIFLPWIGVFFLHQLFLPIAALLGVLPFCFILIFFPIALVVDGLRIKNTLEGKKVICKFHLFHSTYKQYDIYELRNELKKGLTETSVYFIHMLLIALLVYSSFVLSRTVDYSSITLLDLFKHSIGTLIIYIVNVYQAFGSFLVDCILLSGGCVGNFCISEFPVIAYITPAVFLIAVNKILKAIQLELSLRNLFFDVLGIFIYPFFIPANVQLKGSGVDKFKQWMQVMFYDPPPTYRAKRSKRTPSLKTAEATLSPQEV